MSNCRSKILPSRIVKHAIYLIQESISPKELIFEISFRTSETRFSHPLVRSSMPSGRERKAKLEVTSCEGHRTYTSKLTFRRELGDDERQVSLYFESSINPYSRDAPRLFFPIAPTRNHLCVTHLLHLISSQ